MTGHLLLFYAKKTYNTNGAEVVKQDDEYAIFPMHRSLLIDGSRYYSFRTSSVFLYEVYVIMVSNLKDAFSNQSVRFHSC